MMKSAMGEITETNKLLKKRILLHAREPGTFNSIIDGLVFTRHDQPDLLENCFYEPVIGVIIQGAKHSHIGNTEYQYGENHCLVTGVDLPSINRIVGISPEKPFLALSLRVNRQLVTQLCAEIPIQPGASFSGKGMSVAPVQIQVMDAFLRLTELIDTPGQIAVLAPMIIKEIHYYVLTSSQGRFIQQASISGTQNNRIASAISWLRGNYKENVHIEELARQFDMGTSTFHRHFKQITTLSPLQFQKRLRLYEAQRLMLSENKDATTACLAVGYESPTQFNREYKRLFGEPPHRDINRMR